MQGSFITQRMNSELTRNGGKLHVDNDNNRSDRRVSNPKPRNKRNYSQARKLKESSYVYSE